MDFSDTEVYFQGTALRLVILETLEICLHIHLQEFGVVIPYICCGAIGNLNRNCQALAHKL